MTYQLGQTPVPVWAVPDRKPVQVDLETLPQYLLTKETYVSPDVMMDQHPAYISKGTQGGRWNAVVNHDQRKERADIDPTLLDQYDLNSKWENRMDGEIDPTGVIINLDKLRDRFTKNLGSNPFFPIVLRGSASMFSIITLGLSAAVFVQTKRVHIPGSEDSNIRSGHSPTSSTIFTIVMSTISIVYLLYSLWDETFGQPLGLRRAKHKINSVAIDLALLCLTAASLALAFEAMISRNYICPAHQNPRVCKLHKAVVSFIFVTLVTWFLTFLVSTFRMIDRASH